MRRYLSQYSKAMIVLFLSFSSTISFAQSYHLIDLGALNGGNSNAFGINNLGQVVGESYGVDGRNIATIWSAGTITALSGAANAGALSINNSGKVVGVQDSVATIWTGASHSSLNLLQGSNSSSAVGINNAGQIVGNSQVSSGYTHATIWGLDGAPVELVQPNTGYSYSAGVNSQGVVALTTYITETGTDRAHAAVWDNGTLTQLVGIGLGASFAAGINDKGQVVGYSDSGRGSTHATLWTNGVATDLHNIDAHSFATGINNSGQVVGYVGPTNPSETYSTFLWSNGVFHSLDSLIVGGRADFVNLTTARAINDLGQIVGQGKTSDGSYHAFLLSPVPEPSAYILTLIGLSVLLGFKWFCISSRKHISP